MNINGTTQILGVVGFPVKHTLSPPIHNYLIQKYKLHSIYIPLEVTPDKFKEFSKGISKINNFTGFNITVPHKKSIIKHLDRISNEAKLLDAVNTVQIKNNKMIGYNTDYYGFKKSIEYNFPKFKFHGSTILMLGAGGVAKAVANVFLKNRVKKIYIMNRTYKNATQLKKLLAKSYPGKKIELLKANPNILSEIHEPPDMIINTSSYGLNKKHGSIINLKHYKFKKTIIYDLIYNPVKTGLLKTAEKNGLAILNGLDMLILQALESFSIWTGLDLEKILLKELKPLRNILSGR
jgi:shikimate dehydrogenase